MLSVNYPQGFRVVLPYLWPMAVFALAIATGLSAIRLVAAPGFEFYFGPLFYLLAYRWFGLKAGLITATATMLPSIWWWGHPMAVLTAIGHVYAVHRFSGQDRSLSTVTFFYTLLVSVGTIVAWLTFVDPLPAVIVLDIAVRQILCETLLAACADLILLAVLVDTARGQVRRVRKPGLQQSVEALVSMAVAGAAMLFLLGELNHVKDRLELHQQDVASAVRMLPNRNALKTGVVYRLNMHGVDTPLPFVKLASDAPDQAKEILGCHGYDRGLADASGRQSLRYWLDMCYVVTLAEDVAVVSPRDHVIDLFREVLDGILPLMVYLGLAQIGLLIFGASVRRSSRVLSQALLGFGRGYATSRPSAPFAEADRLLGAFIAANNEFVAFDRQRAHLTRTVEELRSAIDLKLLSDIRFDASRGELRYSKIDPSAGQRGASLSVHSADIAHFQSLAGQNEVMVEFRRGQDQDDQWYLLIARDHDAESDSWRYGCLIRLRTAKAFQTQMRHSARLMELGGMASALGHELRQPLFTISLAAENALLQLQNGGTDPERTAAKLERIVEQVERANVIIQRTASYARSERAERVDMELSQAVQNAVRFMRPVMTERDIELEVEIPDHLPVMSLPRIGIEQIIVNALQNAADSIDTRRESAAAGAIKGSVMVHVDTRDQAILLKVTDNGAGIDPSIRNNVLDAFCTTKPEGKGTGLGLFVCRQIMDEVGGSIALADNPGAPGATLTLRFPLPEGE